MKHVVTATIGLLAFAAAPALAANIPGKAPPPARLQFGIGAASTSGSTAVTAGVAPAATWTTSTR